MKVRVRVMVKGKKTRKIRQIYKVDGKFHCRLRLKPKPEVRYAFAG